MSPTNETGWRVYEEAREIQPVKNERTVLPSPIKVNAVPASVLFNFRAGCNKVEPQLN